MAGAIDDVNILMIDIETKEITLNFTNTFKITGLAVDDSDYNNLTIILNNKTTIVSYKISHDFKSLEKVSEYQIDADYEILIPMKAENSKLLFSLTQKSTNNKIVYLCDNNDIEKKKEIYSFTEETADIFLLTWR